MTPGPRARRWRVVLGVVAVFAAICTTGTGPTVAAETFPTRPLRLIVPFPPGAGLDVVARLLAPELSAALGQNVIIDNRNGAGGTLGAAVAAEAPADGYTLLGVSASHAFNPNLYRKLPYDLLRDFTAVSFIATAPNMLVVNSALPASSVQELIALTRARPKTILFASSGAGSASHLAGELFRLAAKVDLVHVPYKGAGPALVALLSGEVQVGFFSIPSTLPHLKSGKLRALAMGTASRSMLLPDLPTVAESGVAGYDASTWYGMLAPARVERSIVDRLQTVTAGVMDKAPMRARLAAQGAEPRNGTPAEFAAFLRAEIEKYRRLAHELNIQPE